jgi:hypothetical protein
MAPCGWTLDSTSSDSFLVLAQLACLNEYAPISCLDLVSSARKYVSTIGERQYITYAYALFSFFFLEI